VIELLPRRVSRGMRAKVNGSPEDCFRFRLMADTLAIRLTVGTRQPSFRTCTLKILPGRVYREIDPEGKTCAAKAIFRF
jgi:hypothetical protein